MWKHCWHQRGWGAGELTPTKTRHEIPESHRSGHRLLGTDSDCQVVRTVRSASSAQTSGKNEQHNQNNSTLRGSRQTFPAPAPHSPTKQLLSFYRENPPLPGSHLALGHPALSAWKPSSFHPPRHPRSVCPPRWRRLTAQWPGRGCWLGQSRGTGLRGKRARGRWAPARGLSQHVCKNQEFDRELRQGPSSACDIQDVPRGLQSSPAGPLAEVDPHGGRAPVGARVLQCLPRAGS